MARGCDVDTSLFGVALHQLKLRGNLVPQYQSYAANRLARSSHFAAAPVQTFRAADGWVFVMCMTEKFWTLLVETLGQEALLTDPRFPR